ncbi:hypothetical protein [Vogesella sp. LIG4]|uniref:hypothetical protein n=1 Tax=Vogesella sp. LIG4 TaxID=1192162 RepID=UPI00081F9219|nr:hypothetical protein [Vogesella sp. LIG4]SCK13800.1 hypothetical protein PSELUDRAFT_1296 [Vogesella sp. LIG4]
MNAYLQLLLAALISLIASVAVLRALSTPLHNLLSRLCPSEHAAAFWLSYTRVMLTIAPLLLTLLVSLFTTGVAPLNSLHLVLIATLAGLLLGLRSIGTRLGRFIPQPPAASPAATPEAQQ